MLEQTGAMDAEALKKIIGPKTLNLLSYVAVILWFGLAVTLSGVFVDIEHRESRFDFHCSGAPERSDDIDNSELYRGKCFELYERRYNEYSVPIYGFVIVHCFLVGFVCAVYAQIASPIVDQLQNSKQSHDDEGRQSRNDEKERMGRKLFLAYCYQLSIRLVIGVLFIILQTLLLYRFEILPKFHCSTTGEDDQRRIIPLELECHNPRAKKKTFWLRALLVTNGTYVLLILIEMLCIFLRRKTFLTDHLNIPDSPQGRSQQKGRK